MLRARDGRRTARKSWEAGIVRPSMKWRTAEPSATPTVAKATAIRSGCAEARVVTSPNLPVQ
jgi:hypothetical protein